MRFAIFLFFLFVALAHALPAPHWWDNWPSSYSTHIQSDPQPQPQAQPQPKTKTTGRILCGDEPGTECGYR